MSETDGMDWPAFHELMRQYRAAMERDDHMEVRRLAEVILAVLAQKDAP